MSDRRATISISEPAGSTRPSCDLEGTAREAEEIRRIWRSLPTDFPLEMQFDSATLCRHKSLILKLARDSYVREVREGCKGPSPAEYCRKYEWLGTPLQQSIHKMLEVQEYALENPELFGSAAAFQWPVLGDQFLNFRILEELGRGATGRVYLCESLNLGNKQVVLKVEAGKNITEATLLGKLRHANITPVHWADFDPSLDATFLCMPFLGRSTLADLVSLLPSDGPPTRGDILDRAGQIWMRQSDKSSLPATPFAGRTRSGSSYVTRVIGLSQRLADGLAFVHREGIAHGDIKPSNVLLAPHGQVYLLDFNLGRNDQAVCHRYGGTPPYMAPEQIRKLLQDDLRVPSIGEAISADIFSFGVLLYELLTGTHPFKISSQRDSLKVVCSTMSKLHNDGYPPAVLVNPAVRGRLSSLIDRCLAIDASARPKSMQEIVDELKSINAPKQQILRTARRNPLGSMILGSCLAGVMAFSVYSYYTRPPRAEQLYRHAEVAYNGGDLETSTALLDDALLSDPKHSEARLLRARSYNDAGDYSRAALDMLYLNRFFPDARHIAYRAYTNQLRGDQKSAVLGYEHAIREGMKNSAILNNLALAYFLSADGSESSELVELVGPMIDEALLANPESPQIHMTAFTHYRRHPQRLEKAIIASTERHINWLSQHVPEYRSIARAIYSYYQMLALYGLVEPAKVEEAKQRVDRVTINETFDRLLDPLETDR